MPAHAYEARRIGEAVQRDRHARDLVGLRAARKHLGWYARNLPHAAAFRRAVNTATERVAVGEHIDRFFTGAIARAAA